MATHKLGFLKFNTSEDGIAFRIGDGKIHQLGFLKKRKPAAAGAYDADAYLDDAGYDDLAYEAGDAAASGGYSGRFAQAVGGSNYGSGYGDEADDDYADDGYADDDYADDAYADDSYADDGYADDDYADDGYADDGYADDDYADDGYADGDYADDGYSDSRYDGGEGDYYGDGGDDYADDGYDDRYSDQDAGDYDEGQGFGSENPVLRYIDENDWVTYALLVLLPPLGIYLLWRRRRFDAPVRWGVSIASGIWFIILLILLISLILSGAGDTTANQPITMNTPTPTIGAASTPETSDSLLQDALSGGIANGATEGITAAETPDAISPAASPTPLAGYDANTVTAGTVLVTATGQYYHNNSNCENLEQGVATSNLTEDVALQRGKFPCPICFPGQEIYYSTANGTYYHSDKTCSRMSNPVAITKAAAEAKGQTPCPVCILKTAQSLERNGLRYATSSTKDQSGLNVWATKGGRYFHTDQNCSGMQNAQSVGLLQAMLAGKTACPTCASSAGRQVWFTEGGKMFHNKSDCSRMRGALQGTLAEALILNKTRCPTCWGNSNISFNGNGVGRTSSGDDSTLVSGGTVYVYATPNGSYYHTNSTCSGMKNAQRVTLAAMLKAGRQACPTCAAGADTTVYATENGKYYHSYATCSGMQNAVAGTQAQAMAVGKQRCPNCWQSTASGDGSSTVYVYATRNGTYYHTNESCSGMKDATRLELAQAVRAGKKACPTCAPAANRKVYSTENGQYYHIKSDCSGMKNAQERTLQEALTMGQSSCPVCLGNVSIDGSVNGVSDVQSHRLSTSSSSSSGSGSKVTGSGKLSSGSKSSVSGVSSNKTSSNSSRLKNVQTGKIQPSTKYKAGASGIKVYATASGKYYHGYKQHAGSGAKLVSIETALNYGKTACPTCLKVAKTTVYAVRGGRYYHRSKSCAGSGAVSGKLSTALASGLDACPVCVTHTKKVTSSNLYKSGASGIKVYATASGKYYHTSKSCAGAGASHVTLEKALNYGKTACPNCAKAANKTVYATASGKYYHASKQHAGSGASAGKWAVAMALGKKACPVCIGGSEAYEESDVKYPASGDTRVYIDTGSTRFYYHKSSHCGDGGLSGGTAVTLDFALSWGFKACPYCNPPTSRK